MLEKRPRQKAARASFAIRIGGEFGAANLRASRLDELPVPYAGRTDGFAGSAIEALTHLFDETRAEKIEARLADGFDETNPAAGA